MNGLKAYPAQTKTIIHKRQTFIGASTSTQPFQSRIKFRSHINNQNFVTHGYQRARGHYLSVSALSSDLTKRAAESTNSNKAPRSPFNTGSMDPNTQGATPPLVPFILPAPKYVVLLRHGLTTWNTQGRIQGNSMDSTLTEQGREQARAAQQALSNIAFDSCFTSSLPRALETARIVWEKREGPVIELPDLQETHLGWLQGMTNAYAAEHHADVYNTWRNQPASFVMNNRRPVVDAFEAARHAWREILSAPGTCHLCVTHKSIMRALVCTALALPPHSFRCVDISNGGLCMFKINVNGEVMVTGMNQTAHLHVDGVRY